MVVHSGGLIDVEAQGCPRLPLGTEFRTSAIYRCSVCHLKTNRAAVGGAGCSLSHDRVAAWPVCPGYLAYPEKHTALSAAIQDQQRIRSEASERYKDLRDLSRRSSFASETLARQPNSDADALQVLIYEAREFFRRNGRDDVVQAGGPVRDVWHTYVGQATSLY